MPQQPCRSGRKRAVLYWIVTGQKPIEAAARVTSDPQEPATVRAKGRYSDAFLQAVDWALTPGDAKRPQSVAEFLPVFTGAADRTGAAHGKTCGAGKRRTFVKLGIGGSALAIVGGGIGFAVTKFGKGAGGGGVRMGVMPGISGATEEIQVKTALTKIVAVLGTASAQKFTVEVVTSFAPAKDQAPYDMILGSTYAIGTAARDLKYTVVGKFRDVLALFIARNDDPVDRLADLKGKRLGLHTRGGMTGPLPGYAIALRAGLEPELSLKLTQALWKFDDSDEGRAALKAISLGSTAGSLEIRQASSREYVRAAEVIEAARQFYPPEAAK